MEQFIPQLGTGNYKQSVGNMAIVLLVKLSSRQDAKSITLKVCRNYFLTEQCHQVAVLQISSIQLVQKYMVM